MDRIGEGQRSVPGGGGVREALYILQFQDSLIKALRLYGQGKVLRSRFELSWATVISPIRVACAPGTRTVASDPVEVRVRSDAGRLGRRLLPIQKAHRCGMLPNFDDTSP